MRIDRDDYTDYSKNVDSEPRSIRFRGTSANKSLPNDSDNAESAASEMLRRSVHVASFDSRLIEIRVGIEHILSVGLQIHDKSIKVQLPDMRDLVPCGSFS